MNERYAYIENEKKIVKKKLFIFKFTLYIKLKEI